MIKTHQRGFTLIELVVVIVILGILAAFAVPRFMGMEGQARASTVLSMGGTLRASASMARAKCQAEGCGPAGNVNVEGQVVTMVAGWPNRATVEFAMQSIDGFAAADNGAAGRRFTKVGGSANCWVQYNNAVAPAAPAITYGVVGVPGSVAFTQALAAAC